MVTKICSTCNKEKDVEEFGVRKDSKDGYKGQCNVCRAEYMKQYCEENKEELSEKQKEYRKEHKEELNENSREYYQEHKEELNEKNREYQKEHKEELRGKKRIYLKKRYHENEQYRITKNLRRRFRLALKTYSITGKVMSSKKYGIDYLAIIEYIGPCPGPNYHVDHILPLVAFDLNNLEHIRLASLPINHQWLTKEENWLKADDYDQEEFDAYIKKYSKES